MLILNAEQAIGMQTAIYRNGGPPRRRNRPRRADRDRLGRGMNAAELSRSAIGSFAASAGTSGQQNGKVGLGYSSAALAIAGGRRIRAASAWAGATSADGAAGPVRRAAAGELPRSWWRIPNRTSANS